MEGRPLQYLLDTGSTENILSRKLFNQLPGGIKAQLKAEETTATMADGSGLLIYGYIVLPCRIRTVQLNILFKVANITDDAILGMNFFDENECTLFVHKGLLSLHDQMLTCTNRAGEMLSNKVQAASTIVVPAGSEAQIVCRLSSPPANTMGIVEHFSENDPTVVVAATLTKLNHQGKFLVRCLNAKDEPVTLKAGTTLGLYTPVNQDQVFQHNGESIDTPKCQTVSETSLPAHMLPLFEQACVNCKSAEEKSALAKLLAQYADVFSSDDADVGQTNLVSHSIPVEPGTTPIRQAPRRLGVEKDQEVERQVEELVKKKLVVPGDGAWSSPVVLVRKKDQTWRLCVDYRALNAVTRKDAYPLPRIDDSLDALAGSVFFSTLDLLSGYWQVPLDQDAQDKAAFVTRGGLWKWRVLPFGLTSAPATFERLMEQVLKGLQWKSLLLYLDDIIVYSTDFNSHLERLRVVLERFKAANLKLKPSKCELLQREVKFLGHVVNEHGVSTDPDKVKAVREWPTPKCQSEVRTFLGFVGYYRKFCPDYATVAKPLNRIASKSQKDFVWGTEEEDSFQCLRQFILESPVLAYPDYSKEFLLDTDASLDGAGAVLSQIQDGEERVIAYFSKTFSPAERNYCVTRRELLAIVMATKHFRPYLYGRKFGMRTDHASLQWLYRRKEPSHQVARWLELLAEYHFKLSHRAGVKHGNADGLSRVCIDCKQCNSIEKRDGGPTWAELQVEDNLEVGSGYILEGRQPTTPAERRSTERRPTELEGSSHAHSANRISTASELRQDIGPLQQTPGSDIALIRKCVETGVDPSPVALEQGSGELKKLSSLIPVMEIQDGILKVRMQINNRHTWVIVCPKQLRPVIIQQYHGQHHSGVNKTYKRVKLKWYWPGMSSQIRNLVRKCEICQAAKNSKPNRKEYQQRLFAGRPWQVLSVDLVGPFCKTPRGNTMILVISDHFTRWRDAIAIRDGTTAAVAEALERQVFCYFGIPERIHSDKGAAFESSMMKELCKVWGVAKSRTTPWHPEGNGVVERGNKDLGNALRTFLLTRDESDWDLLLPHLTRAVRSVPHSMTGETANYMMFGRELSLPEDLLAEPNLPLSSREDYVGDLIDRLQAAHDFVRSKQEEIRAEDQQAPPLFSAGDYVWLKAKRHPKGTTPKLQPKWQGPYKVLEAYNNHTYLVDLNSRQSVESESRLKLHISADGEWGRAPVLPEPTRHPPRPGYPRQSRKNGNRQEREVENFSDLLQKFRNEITKQDSGVADLENNLPQDVEIPNVETDSRVEVKPKVRESDSQSEVPKDTGGDNSRQTRIRRPPARLDDYVVYQLQSANEMIDAKTAANRLEAVGGAYPIELGSESANENPVFTMGRNRMNTDVARAESHSQSNSRAVNIANSLNMSSKSRIQSPESSVIDLMEDEDYILEEVLEAPVRTDTPDPAQTTKVNKTDKFGKIKITGLDYQKICLKQKECRLQNQNSSPVLGLKSEINNTRHAPVMRVNALSGESKTSPGGNEMDFPLQEKEKHRHPESYISHATRAKFNRLYGIIREQRRCDSCDRQFGRQLEEQLRIHAWSHCVASVCKICGHIAGRPDQINQHKRDKHPEKEGSALLKVDPHHWDDARNFIPNLPHHCPPLPIRTEKTHRKKRPMKDARDVRRRINQQKERAPPRTVSIDRSPDVKKYRGPEIDRTSPRRVTMDKENIQITAQPPQLPMDYLPEPVKGLPQQYFTRKPDLQRSDSSDSNFTSVSQHSDKYRFLTPPSTATVSMTYRD